jgi:hypothetical protein
VFVSLGLGTGLGATQCRLITAPSITRGVRTSPRFASSGEGLLRVPVSRNGTAGAHAWRRLARLPHLVTAPIERDHNHERGGAGHHRDRRSPQSEAMMSRDRRPAGWGVRRVAVILEWHGILAYHTPAACSGGSSPSPWLLFRVRMGWSPLIPVKATTQSSSPRHLDSAWARARGTVSSSACCFLLASSTRRRSRRARRQKRSLIRAGGSLP